MANAASSSSDSTIKEEGHDDCQVKKDDEIRILVESIQEVLGDVSSLQPYYDIYRIPKQLHKLKPEAYTPQSVSIGPLHYNEEHLQPMQAHKTRYLNHLLQQHSEATLDVYVKAVSELEEKARQCYSETMGFGNDEFVKMMVMDGCFILVLLMHLTFGEEDYLLSYPARHWEIVIDLIKLENQLPFFVLEHLHGLIFVGRHELPQYTTSHHILAWLLLVAQGLHGLDLSDEQVVSLPLPEGGAKHFLDLLRHVFVPSSPMTRKLTGEKRLTSPSCASQLKRAGVQFQKKEKSESPMTSLFDIAFDMEKGVLTIPTISIVDHTEPILRNLIAFEQGQEDY